MSIMNVLWDVMSDVIVALIGYFVFGEVFTIQQCVGIVFCMVGITLLGVK
jgi:multidrug transporter EmrE-like cation transporter